MVLIIYSLSNGHAHINMHMSYVYTYTHIHTHTYTHIHTHYIHTHTHKHTHTHIHKHATYILAALAVLVVLFLRNGYLAIPVQCAHCAIIFQCLTNICILYGFHAISCIALYSTMTHALRKLDTLCMCVLLEYFDDMILN